LKIVIFMLVFILLMRLWYFDCNLVTVLSEIMLSFRRFLFLLLISEACLNLFINHFRFISFLDYSILRVHLRFLIILLLWLRSLSKWCYFLIWVLYMIGRLQLFTFLNLLNLFDWRLIFRTTFFNSQLGVFYLNLLGY
jgi:hypothetical protein